MKKPTCILIVEDIAADAELAKRAICKVLKDCEFQVVETRNDFLKALKSFQPDVILSDYALPSFDGMTALKLALEHAPFTPVIIWTGSKSEDVAVDCMKAGANNYVIKEDLKRLGPAVLRALEDKQLLIARTQAEELLREERNLLRTLIDNVPDRIYAMDLYGRKTLANTADWQASGGKTMEDVIGKTDYETYPPGLAEEFWKLDKTVLESGQPVINYEEPGLDADGNLVSILTTKIPLRDSEGKIMGLVGIGRDITERKQVEARINDLLAFNEKILNHSSVGIITYKVTGQCIYANEKAAAVIGTNVAQLLTQNFRTVEAWKKSGLYDLVEKAIRTQAPVTDDIHHVSTFGKEVWMTVHCVTFRSRGEDHVLLSLSDITERKQAEDKLRESENRLFLALSGAQMGVWEWNLQTNQIIWSPEFFRITGVNEDQFAGTFESFTDLIHEDDVARVRKSAEKAMMEQTLFAEEFRIIRPDGEIRWLSNLGHAEYDSTGSYLRLIGTVQDITQRKQAEVERQALLEITQGLADTEDLNELLKLIHRSIAQVIYAENFFVVMYQPGTGLFEEIYSVDKYDLPEPPARLEKSITSYVFRSGEPLLLTQELFDELARQGEMKLVGTNSASWLGVPLKSSGKTIGVMAVQDYENDNRYSERDKDFLASIAAQVALVIERKQAEEALHKSEALYRQAIEVAGAVPYYESYYDEGRLIKYEFIGEGIRQITGYGPEEFNATLWDSLVEEVTLIEDLAGYSLDEGIQRVRAGKNSIWKCEHRLRDRDGNIHWVLEAAVELRDENGVSHGSIGTYQDITTRKQAEAVLRESEENYRAIFDGVQDAIFVESRDGRILMVNEQACKIFGYSHAEFLTKTVADIVPEGHLILTAEGSDALLSAEPRESVNRRANGEIFPIEISGRLQVIHGETVLLVVVREITERKRAEALLRESEERFSSAFEYAAIGMALVALDGQWLRINWALSKLVGYSQEELLQKTFQDITHPEDQENDLHYRHQLLTGEIHSYQMEKRYFHQLGHIIWVLLSVSLIQDHKGKPLYFIYQIQDITERKQVEAKLQASESRYRLATQATKDVIWQWTAEDNQLIWTENAQLVFGYSLEEIGPSGAWWDEHLHPHDRERVISKLNGLTATVDGGSVWSEEYRLLLKDGSYACIDDHAYLERDPSGKLIRMIGAMSNITERKRAEEALRVSEERFRQMAENIQEVFWMTDAETGGELYASPAAEVIWGRPIESLMSKPNTYSNSIFPEDRAVVLQEIEKEKNGEKVEMEYRIVRPDGSIRWIWERAFPIFDDSGKVRRIAGISADITERKEAAEKLRESEDRYHSLFQNQIHGCALHEIITDDQGQPIDYVFLKVNPAFEKMTGLHAQDLVGRRFTEALPGTENEKFIQIFGQVALTGEPAHINEYVAPLGKYYEINAYSTGPRRFAVSFMDVTERRQAEQQLRKLSRAVEQSASTIVITDTTGGIEYVNPKFTEITGYTLEEAIGENPRILKSGFTLPEEYEHLWQAITSGNEWHGELLNRKKNGELYWEYATIAPILNENGEITHFLAVKEDITERKQAEEQIRRHAEETSALLETSLALTNLDLKAILQNIGNSARELFTADGCRIFLMQPDGASLRCVLAFEEDAGILPDMIIKLGQGVTGSVAASGQAEIVNEMQNDPRAVQVPGTQEEEEEAIMFAPLKERDHTIGVISVRRASAAQRFEPADLELLEAFASMAASAVSNARLFEETQRRLSEQEAIYENGLAVGRLLKPTEIGERIITTFARYLSWHHVTIRLRREDSDDLELVAFNLPKLQDEEQANAAQHFIARINKVGQGLSGWVIQTGVPLRAGDIHAHPQYIDTHSTIHSGLYMPLRVGERVIGVISVESETPDAFTEQDERLLATLANQAAIAFENARLYETIQKELAERKRAEEALRASETHYRELADSITDILFEMDQDLRYTHWNKTSEAFSGIPAEQAIGKSMVDIFGDSQENTEREKIYRSVLKDRQPRTFEIEVIAKEQKRALEMNAYPSTRGVSVVAKDITDRKRSEIIMQKRFELMEYAAHHSLSELTQRMVDDISELTGSTIGFFHFVEADQVTLGMQTWSTRALQLFNVPPAEGTHRSLDQAGMWAEAVRQRRPLIQNDYALLPTQKSLPQGHVPIERSMVIPIFRNDRIMAVMGIANKPQDYTLYDLEIAARLADYAWDITERKQMQMALENERNQLAQRVEERTSDLSRANSNLARALRVKDEFLANMSHELRTPLNAILGLSESLGEQIAGPLNEKQQKYITTISESGHHLLSLINDILDLAKIEAGQITLDINKMDINLVCQASLRMVKQLAQKKNQELTLQIDAGLGVMWADERRLKQMIVNLLGNAVKFTPENGKIGLEVHGDQEANKITITVWDNGIGISEANLNRLFRPFVQLDSGLAREATGTGLGLALVAQMARLHGGSVSALSEPGKGSRFSLLLPWEPALAPDAEARLRTTGKFPAIKPDETNKPTILLVEDTKEVIMMIRDYLELAGYKVVTAQDGVDGIAQAKLIRPDLILMDVMMPRMDGFEATRKLRSEPDFRYTPIIALTALAMPSDRERCLAAGMDEYISKPINLKTLVKIIQSCLFNNEESR